MKAEIRVLRSALMFGRVRKQALQKDNEVKGFLGPSLRENNDVPSIGRRAALGRGLIVDDNGKMRCPAGTPNANQFTDLQMSNCMIPSAETVVSSVADVVQSAVKEKHFAADGFKRSSFSSGIKTPEAIPVSGVGAADENGFLSLFRRGKGSLVVPPVVGSPERLNTQEESVLHVSNGGSIIDVPDEHLVPSILENIGDGKRFRLIGEGGGINGMTRVSDTKTGALIGVKYSNGLDVYSQRTDNMGYTESSNEYIAELFSEHFGYEPVPMRVVPIMETTKFDWGDIESAKGLGLVTELIHNRREGKTESARISDRNDTYEYDADLTSAIRMAVFDMVISNRDRHEGNFLLQRQGNSQAEYVPIDHSMAFTGGPTPTSVKDLMSPLLHLEVERALSKQIADGGTDSAEKMIIEIQEKMKSIDVEKLQTQIDAYMRHVRSMNIDSSQYKDNYARAIDAIKVLRDANPNEILEAVMPEWKRKYYADFANQQGFQQPIMDLEKLANPQADLEMIGQVDL